MSLSSVPEALEASPEEKQRLARQRMEEAGELLDLGLEGELEEVSVTDLEYGVNAVTIPTLDGSKILIDSSRFFHKEYEEQVDIAAEEALHVKQQNGSFGDWLIDRHGAYDLANEFSGTRYRRDLEGEAEIVLEELLEHGTSYPYFKVLKRSELDRKGIDPDSQLAQEIEEFQDEVLDMYAEGYGLEAGNLYSSNYLSFNYFSGTELSYLEDDYDEVYAEGENGFESPVKDDVGVPETVGTEPGAEPT